MTVQPPCATAVLTDHFFGFRSLVLVVFGQGLLIPFFSLSLLFRHHALGLTNRPAGAVGGTRTRKQEQQQHPKNSFSFHLILDYRSTNIRFLKKTSTFAA